MAAAYYPRGFFYRADIVTEFIPDASDLVEVVEVVGVRAPVDVVEVEEVGGNLQRALNRELLRVDPSLDRLNADLDRFTGGRDRNRRAGQDDPRCDPALHAHLPEKVISLTILTHWIFCSTAPFDPVFKRLLSRLPLLRPCLTGLWPRGLLVKV